jgi:hypothetical protein
MASLSVDELRHIAWSGGVEDSVVFLQLSCAILVWIKNLHAVSVSLYMQ